MYFNKTIFVILQRVKNRYKKLFTKFSAFDINDMLQNVQASILRLTLQKN